MGSDSMKVKITPSKLIGTIDAPSSKSMCHRLLICAGLSEGESLISNVLFSEDILATLDCLSAMGAKIKKGKDFVSVVGANVNSADKRVYNCRESGSTLRFFIPIAMLREGESLFTGYGRLMERPMSVYENIAKEKSLFYKKDDDGIRVGGKLTAGSYIVPANVSSQFISGLLFALPLCNGDSTIILTGTIESKSYIDMTIAAMKSFGVDAKWQDDTTIYIKGNQQYKAQNLTVEGDCSNGAFLDAFNLLGSDVKLMGLREDTLQGDMIYKDYFSLLRQGTPTLDIKNCPDLAPILMSLAAALHGCKLINTARLKIKESDRGSAMAQELSKFGADVKVYENEIVVNKRELHMPNETLSAHNDHRVVMSLSVLSSVYGGVIEGAQGVKKSYPDFFDKVKALGMEVEVYGD